MPDPNVVHFKVSPDNLGWLRRESRESGIPQVKLLNILLDYARNSGMQIRLDDSAIKRPS